MAKTGMFDDDQADPSVVAAKATELKKELKKLVQLIVDDHDDSYSLDTIQQANQILSSLKDLKTVKRSQSLGLREDESVSVSSSLSSSSSVPDEFKCPLSKKLMKDPVVLSSGQTYDLAFIQKWLKAGNKTCPQTQQVLSHAMLTPNHLIREMILQWCKSKGVEFPNTMNYTEEDLTTEVDRNHFFDLLKKMSSTPSDQKKSAKELRSLTKRLPSFRALFGESEEGIPQLLKPLTHIKVENLDLDLQEDLITTLLNLSIHDNNKMLVAETPIVIPLLLDAVKSGTIQTRSNAAATIFTLSALDSNKALIGKSGALKPLIDLLDEGHPLAMNDVASAIFNLCIVHENKARAVRDGVVRVLMKKIMDNTLVDELLAILAMVSGHQKAIEEIGDFGAVPCLLKIIRENLCGRNKENCIAILHTICLYDRTKLKEMREEERVYGTISKLAQNGTSRAKRKASGVLERLNKSMYSMHTA